MIDAFERHEIEYVEGIVTDDVVNIYRCYQMFNATPTRSEKMFEVCLSTAYIRISLWLGNTALYSVLTAATGHS
jgi:hypothetical protein